MNLEPVALAAEALAKACRAASLPTIEIVEPTFTTSPPPADLHPMCDAELDRLMTHLADRAAEYGQGSVAETMKAIRAFVRRKFDAATKPLHTLAANLRADRDLWIENNSKLSAEVKDLRSLFRDAIDGRDKIEEQHHEEIALRKKSEAERDAAREVVREMMRACFPADPAAGSLREWCSRAGIDPMEVRADSFPPIFQGAPSVGVPLQAPLTGHATGCTLDRCVPTCPSPRGKR